MSSPRQVLHVFPYDPRHLGQSFERWADSQLERWPLAAVGRSGLAARSTVHVVGPRRRTRAVGPLEVVEHRSLTCGPPWRDWGDDWSAGLQRALARLGADDVCVIHLNDYAAARLAQRAARRSRVVVVFHGRGLRGIDEHARADRLLVLREDAAEELGAGGAAAGQVVVMPPSVDRDRFRPSDGAPAAAPVRLGFVGRLEASKGVLEVPAVIARLREAGIAGRAELVGPCSAAQRAAVQEVAAATGVADRIDILGELPSADIAGRMREWRALLLPSYTEGHPIVALEACASRLPVAAVTGVLPGELEARPAVAVAPRERYPELVLDLVRTHGRPPPADWVRDHRTAGAEWDKLLETLPPWRPSDRPPAPRLWRARRLRPPRRVARAVLRRGG